ncbi:MAG: methyltransferase domain-containing protein [Alphaproteobacteria bacterium]|nr:methyltransferase domain-containing protein [Alphaproteobacteria bacterium]
MPSKPSNTGKPRPRPTLGPLADLEAHLPAEWWRELFTSLYLKTDGDVVENAEATRQEVDTLLAAAPVDEDAAILDLCCGQGRHSLELARRGFKHVTGVDRSGYLIRLARRRAKKEGLQVAFREGDARSFRMPKASLDLVCMMGNSFGYFERDEDDLAVLLAVKAVLKPGGIFSIDIADGSWMRENFEPRSWEWIDQNQFVCRERSLSSDGDRLVSREVVTHAERGVIADQLYAERLYSRDAIEALLAAAGFRDITFHQTITGTSTRGQDLGMMAHRLFLTCEAPPLQVLAPAKERGPREVWVVMGDASLPDSVKAGGQFNAEDFETIEQLKSALAGFSGHTFRYIDRHATLIDDLRDGAADIVLNLCDEGFGNDAFKELHVPALLEMLGLPYTGAGPACLGICYDKALVRAMAQALDIPVPLETYVRAGDRQATLPSVFPALLKPAHGDSSIGITQDAVVRDPEALLGYLAHLNETLPNRPVLVQEFLTGAEYSVALIGNPAAGLEALPILEVDYSSLDPDLPRILGYESKWHPDSPYWKDIRYVETGLDADRQREMVVQASRLFEVLGCRDYARFDFRADANGAIKLLEANPNPGWCWDGKLNLMAGFAGMSYADLLERILEVAFSRVERVRPARARKREPAVAARS